MDWAFEGSGSLIKGWHGEVPSDYTGPTTTLANKTTLSNTTIDTPGFWTRGTDASSGSGPASVVAWAGTDSAHHLNIMTSNDGFRYGNKLTLSSTSLHRPSVAVTQENGASVVAIAWLGADSRHLLYVLYDVYHAQHPTSLKTVLPMTSPYPPTLAAFGGQLWLAWAGTNAQHSINVMPIGPTGQSPGTVTTLAGTNTSAAPMLVADAGTNQLLAAWQDASNSHLTVAQSPDGTTWTVLPVTPATSHKAPDLTAIGAPPDGMSPYLWTWISASDNHTIYLKQGATLSDWQSSLKLRESSPFAPSLGYVGRPHEVMVVWAGTDSAHHLNVASIPI